MATSRRDGDNTSPFVRINTRRFYGLLVIAMKVCNGN